MESEALQINGEFRILNSELGLMAARKGNSEAGLEQMTTASRLLGTDV